MLFGFWPWRVPTPRLFPTPRVLALGPGGTHPTHAYPTLNSYFKTNAEKSEFLEIRNLRSSFYSINGGMPLSYSEPRSPLEWCARMEGTDVDLSPPEEDDTKENERKGKNKDQNGTGAKHVSSSLVSTKICVYIGICMQLKRETYKEIK